MLPETWLVAPPFDAALQDKLLALNNAHALELSYKTADEFSDLLARASFVRAEQSGLAFLVGFDAGCSYDNDNFRWQKQHYQRFNYIDRVVVDQRARGLGLARGLYMMFEEATRAGGHERLVCEINSVPANPASDAFHERLGFRPVGERVVGPDKTVRYWAKELTVSS